MARVGFRLYLISDRKLTGDRGLLATCEAVFAAAARLGSVPAIALQLREKDLAGRALYRLAGDIGELCRAYQVPMLVNERIDVALAARAAGVHLPADSVAPDEARKLLGPDALIGVSTHAAHEIVAAAAAGADFAVFGPVFTPISKTGYQSPCGPQAVGLAAAAAPMPVFALGGIDPARTRELAGCGARGVALIGAIMSAPDPGAAARAVLEELRAWESGA